jgi:hypothetical protein
VCVPIRGIISTYPELITSLDPLSLVSMAWQTKFILADAVGSYFGGELSL